MHKNILKIVELIEAPKQFIISGAILMGLFNLSLVPAPQELGSGLLELKHAGQYAEGAILESISIPKAQALVVDTPIAKIFFGEAGSSDTTHGLIEKQIGFVSSRKAYPASLSVIKKHERIIRSKAREYGVPEDVAIGVGLLENGGSDTAKSPAGALGVFQLMPGTARSLGLIVNGKVDERRNPEKNIDAGMRYLALNYYRFGDWGLATWAYHAGEGNVSKAIKIYAESKHKVKLDGLKDVTRMRTYVDKNKITIHELLSHPNVKAFTKRLNDDSSGYPYKVLATATLFKTAQ